MAAEAAGRVDVRSHAPAEAGQSPTTTSGTESVRSLGVLWFVTEGRGEIPGGGPATTSMTLGYDTQKKRYVGTWIGEDAALCRAEISGDRVASRRDVEKLRSKSR